MRFVNSWLRSGMVVLDIGAHQGYYTLLATRKVGPDGRVFAFEPSPRERKNLLFHVRIDRRKNVRVEGFALSNETGEAELFFVIGSETGCNSLRPPAVNQPTQVLRVPTRKLDDYICELKIARVDFIKMDVEGAELLVLKGAEGLLRRQPRPVILCEVQDIRTQPWGYKAREILDFLSHLEYGWFVPLPDGGLCPFRLTDGDVDGNFVAIPREHLDRQQTGCSTDVLRTDSRGRKSCTSAAP
jgi:FkbM family methyltransferase